MNVVRLYIRSVDKITEIIGLSVSVLMPVMVIVLGIEVVARYGFGRPTIWAFDTSIFLFGYIGLLAGAHVHQLRSHINVDIIYAMFSPRGKAILDVLNGLLIFFFILLVILTTWEPAVEAIVNHETRSGEWAPPVGHFKLMIPVGASLVLLQQAANWIKSLYWMIKGKELTL
jgi:TRAP-type mannitol/chloroaromatic compound transport system permease small subunit